MKLLITTYNKVILWEDGEETILDDGRGIYFGATWDEDRMYIATRNFEGDKPYNHNGRNEIMVFEDYEYTGTLPVQCLNAVHQIFYYDGYLYVVNSRFEQIEKYDIEEQTQKIIKWSKYRYAVRKHSEHINSLWFDGKYWYVAEHNWGPSTIRMFDDKWRYMNDFQLGREIHDVWHDDEWFYTCSSGTGHIARAKLRNVLDDQIVHVGEYPRGLAATTNRLLIGLSPQAEREGRFKGDASFIELDRDLNVLDEHVLPGSGQVNVIHILEGDLAHNGIDYE